MIGEIAGHSSLQTTMKYVHADAKTRANAVASIEGCWWPSLRRGPFLCHERHKFL